MKKLAVLASSLVFAAMLPVGVPEAGAKEKTPKPEPTATPAATASPAATATPAPKKPGFFDRLNPFRPHEKKPKATPTPAPSPSPSATPEKSPTPEPEKKSSRKRTSKKSTPEPEETPTPKPRRKATPTPEPEETSTPKPKPTPKATPEPETPADTPTNGLNSPLPFSPEADAVKPSASATPTASFAAGLDDEAVAKARYRAVKNQALEDKSIVALQDKADSARDEDSQRSLTKAYYRALFDKMRDLDPTLKARIDRIEAATMKRLQNMTASPGGDE